MTNTTIYHSLEVERYATDGLVGMPKIILTTLFDLSHSIDKPVFKTIVVNKFINIKYCSIVMLDFDYFFLVSLDFDCCIVRKVTLR